MRLGGASTLCIVVALAGCGGATASTRNARESAGAETEAEAEAGTETESEAVSETERRSEEPTQSAVLAGSRSDPRRPENPVSETAPVPETPPAPRASLPGNPAIDAQLTILERETSELDRFTTVMIAARERAFGAPGAIPPICGDRSTIEELRIIGTSGSAGANHAIAAAEALDEWCGRFDRWAQPDERLRLRITAYASLLDRITGWMQDIQRCVGATGAEEARCRNAYSQTTLVESDEAGRILALLDVHRRELAGVASGAAPFPCTTPTLERIASTTDWVGSVARAQMTSLPRQANEVCESFGVGERTLRDATRRVRAALDQAESGARSQRRQALETMEMLRPLAGR